MGFVGAALDPAQLVTDALAWAVFPDLADRLAIVLDEHGVVDV